jgi:hypothetical protein
VLTLAEEGKMRIARQVVVVVALGTALLASSGVAQAGWFGSKQPKPLDLLARGRNWDPSHINHPLREYKYNRPGWGGLWKQVYASHPNRPHAYIRGY